MVTTLAPARRERGDAPVRAGVDPNPAVRVLHVLGRMQPGGAELRTLEVLERLCPCECHADVCALSGREGSLDARVRALGGEVVPLRFDAMFPARFLQLLRRRRYDVVHSHVLYTSGLVLALAAASRVPVRVAHFRAMHDGHRSTVRRLAQRALMRRLIDRYATDIVGCGEGAMDAVWDTGWRTDPRCQIIYNAVDPTRFALAGEGDRVRADLHIAPGAKVYLHIGNEVREKNHGRLLAIFAAIHRGSPSSRLVLAGAGTDDPIGVSARAARDHGVADSVLALGIRQDVPRLLACADVLLLPSLAEGLPGVVLEACAAGVPVLATDLPGVREVAARLALVRMLPLTAADSEWAAAAAALPAEAERIRLRQAAADAFRATVFDVNRAVEMHRSLWRLPVSQATPQCS
jgi:glycosyltransferase involved in cell wall biosynthesis